ncbi:hypothetical protein WAF17_16895 [Bernardetia sp. ABR2-2B]|uniref:hypothetical protein n=1 Tax=Bernardetia sp. ABR2-2B TaxID=3127472 RepID=UPI0030D14A47
MKNNLVEILKKVCEIFNRHSIDYILVGGTAVALNGYFRMSFLADGKVASKLDLDFWYNPSYSNYFKLLNALEDLGRDMTRAKEEQAPNPKKSFFRYEFEEFTLDLLPKMDSRLDFRSSFDKKEVTIFDDVQVSFLCLEDVIKDKEFHNRPKDREDIEQLKKIKSDKENL